MAVDAMSMLLALAAIVALILALAFVVRRLQGVRQSQGSGIEVVTSRMLGAKERLVLVQVADQQVLVGINGQSMSALASFPAPKGAFEVQLDAAVVGGGQAGEAA